MASSLNIAVLLVFVGCARLATADDECGDGYSCAWCNGVYGCMSNSDRRCVCCSQEQTEADCAKAGNGSVLPTCPAGGATKQGCVRAKRLASEDHQFEHQLGKRDSAIEGVQAEQAFGEDCGDGYSCIERRLAYGCAKEPITPDSQMVCCSTGDSKAECATASNGNVSLPFCPAGGATGPGCLRKRLRPRQLDGEADGKSIIPVND